MLVFRIVRGVFAVLISLPHRRASRSRARVRWCACAEPRRAAQVENMTQKHHVYMTKDGRISLAGAAAGPAPPPRACSVVTTQCAQAQPKLAHLQ